jgi:hypothetical protein
MMIPQEPVCHGMGTQNAACGPHSYGGSAEKCPKDILFCMGALQMNGKYKSATQTHENATRVNKSDSLYN